jgi:hypothetical protein
MEGSHTGLFLRHVLGEPPVAPAKPRRAARARKPP